MSKAEEAILIEYERFRAQLPQLLEKYPGKWVVFRNDAVESAHDTEDEAMQRAMDKFGLNGGHVIARVAEIQVTPLTAGVMFGQHGS